MSQLASGRVFATLAVKDMTEARTFYGETLGLTMVDDSQGGVVYESGDSQLFVYESQFAGTNQATAATWQVENIDAVVEELKARGVTFEHYDVPETEWQGDIAAWGPMKSAWFKDPSGNTIAVTNKVK